MELDDSELEGETVVPRLAAALTEGELDAEDVNAVEADAAELADCEAAADLEPEELAVAEREGGGEPDAEGVALPTRETLCDPLGDGDASGTADELREPVLLALRDAVSVIDGETEDVTACRDDDRDPLTLAVATRLPLTLAVATRLRLIERDGARDAERVPLTELLRLGDARLPPTDGVAERDADTLAESERLPPRLPLRDGVAERDLETLTLTEGEPPRERDEENDTVADTVLEAPMLDERLRDDARLGEADVVADGNPLRERLRVTLPELVRDAETVREELLEPDTLPLAALGERDRVNEEDPLAERDCEIVRLDERVLDAVPLDEAVTVGSVRLRDLLLVIL